MQQVYRSLLKTRNLCRTERTFRSPVFVVCAQRSATVGASSVLADSAAASSALFQLPKRRTYVSPEIGKPKARSSVRNGLRPNVSSVCVQSAIKTEYSSSPVAFMKRRGVKPESCSAFRREPNRLMTTPELSRPCASMSRRESEGLPRTLAIRCNSFEMASRSYDSMKSMLSVMIQHSNSVSCRRSGRATPKRGRYSAQFAMASPFTMPKCFTLLVTRTASSALACAAIIVSMLPMGVPTRSSPARTSAN